MEVYEDFEIIFAKERLLWDDTYNKGVKACFCHFHVSTMEPPNFHSSSNIRSHLDNMNLPCLQFRGQSSVMIQPWVMIVSYLDTCQSETQKYVLTCWTGLVVRMVPSGVLLDRSRYLLLVGWELLWSCFRIFCRQGSGWLLSCAFFYQCSVLLWRYFSFQESLLYKVYHHRF